MGKGAPKDWWAMEMGCYVCTQRAVMPRSGGSWWAKTHLKEQLKSLDPARQEFQWLLLVGEELSLLACSTKVA